MLLNQLDGGQFIFRVHFILSALKTILRLEPLQASFCCEVELKLFQYRLLLLHFILSPLKTILTLKNNSLCCVVELKILTSTVSALHLKRFENNLESKTVPS